MGVNSPGSACSEPDLLCVNGCCLQEALSAVEEDLVLLGWVSLLACRDIPELLYCSSLELVPAKRRNKTTGRGDASVFYLGHCLVVVEPFGLQ